MRGQLVLHRPAAGHDAAYGGVAVGERLDRELGALVVLEPGGAEHVVPVRALVQLVVQRRRVVERRARQAVEAGQPVGHDLGDGVDARVLLERPVVPLAEQPLGLERDVVEPEVGPGGVGGVVGAAVLVGQPAHLARVLGVVGREVGRDHQVAVERDHAPGERSVEEPALLPADREPDQLGTVTLCPERGDQVLLEQLGPAPYERHLRAADDHVHVSTSLSSGTSVTGAGTVGPYYIGGGCELR